MAAPHANVASAVRLAGLAVVKACAAACEVKGATAVRTRRDAARAVSPTFASPGASLLVRVRDLRTDLLRDLGAVEANVIDL